MSGSMDDFSCMDESAAAERSLKPDALPVSTHHQIIKNTVDTHQPPNQM
jgi:hypothetical protein